MIKINQLNIRFQDEIIFNDFSLNIEDGIKFAITGKSGSGKSTLLNVLAGFNPDFIGEVTIGGIELKAKNISEIRKFIAWLPQETSINFGTVKELFYLPFSFEQNRNDLPKDDEISEIFKAFDLDKSIMLKKAKDISGGQKQRILLASCLLLKKPLLLIDEPTSALDVEIKTKITDYILNKKKLTVICSTHDDYWINKSDKVIKLGE